MAIKIEAWKDDKGRIYATEEEANTANLFREIMTGFNIQYEHSASKGILLDYVLDNYDLIKKVKK